MVRPATLILVLQLTYRSSATTAEGGKAERRCFDLLALILELSLELLTRFLVRWFDLLALNLVVQLTNRRSGTGAKDKLTSKHVYIVYALSGLIDT